ncbi:probable short chain dehydrogenase [Pseudooceanicola batsensis HTCC2597]|uniref:Probable short chain dehydrogenase n=1 Tax=Pseudooceanicola batsensis (strain ATCC BAA-863 / DSM 15984 / KCTC 12145 / HTCC2597) TaxID=252305 RepID=A3U0E1_PSEBH|nr:SDR family NAD(P)-dependent oxidoreductase [Pseudooceanicola batsensis]EAQ02232.1 probable short chain dehydrogenase [Pseudooceanicola batsensis HTCC2597]
MTGRRIALVGGAGGIGRALAADLTDLGDEIITLDLAGSLDRHGVAGGVAIDVTDEDSVSRAFASLDGPVDGVVNLAGYNSDLTAMAEMGTDYFDDILNANLRGAFLVARTAISRLAENGSMVNIASGLASHVRPGYGAYSASKAAVIAMTKTMALELAPKVRVNAVAPGLVDTAFLRGGTGRSEEDGESIVDLEAYKAMIPLARVATPADVTGPIRFLLGPDSGYMTGQVLWVNGGGYMP